LRKNIEKTPLHLASKKHFVLNFHLIWLHEKNCKLLNYLKKAFNTFLPRPIIKTNLSEWYANLLDIINNICNWISQFSSVLLYCTAFSAIATAVKNLGMKN